MKDLFRFIKYVLDLDTRDNGLKIEPIFNDSVLAGTKPAAMKDLFRFIKYVLDLDTRDSGLKIEPIFNDSGMWDLFCHTLTAKCHLSYVAT
eukprot:scaffold8799_cov52-Cyclotella_meneghiniana.AAC.3